ncbi:MAG TPA: hypothetical protein PK453_12115 [Leptospiraceae bacterium]|nr:hypothetical protein [Leptospiraceae bacterium]HNF14407.1 hypothetical protein [Leptospiraceae bacterium]HNF25012.1 hypothetical protein [Leptospiraceae bacterium]HNM05979.1 hypothetical protein [Leptospiraceae bacterium]HNN02108.1 hypothetical protein [Leptospiraceae bacterium]
MLRICILIILLFSCRNTELSSVSSDVFNPKNPAAYFLANSLGNTLTKRGIAYIGFQSDRMILATAYDDIYRRFTAFESTDGTNFTKSQFDSENCNGSYTDSGCSILEIKFENGSYRVLLVNKTNGKPTGIRIGTGSSLSSLTFTKTAPPSGFLNVTTSFDMMNDFLSIHRNQTQFIYAASTLYSVTDSKWQSVSMTNSKQCKSLYLNDTGNPTCDLLYYHNGSIWTNSPFSTTDNIIQTSNLYAIAPVFYINGKYWAFTQNGFLYSSSSGTFLSSLTFSPLYALSGVWGLYPKFSLRSDGKGLVAVNRPAQSASDTMLDIFTSSDSGSTWLTGQSMSLLTVVGIGSLGNTFYMLTAKQDQSSILYKSDSGTSWTAVTLPSF